MSDNCWSLSNWYTLKSTILVYGWFDACKYKYKQPSGVEPAPTMEFKMLLVILFTGLMIDSGSAAKLYATRVGA